VYKLYFFSYLTQDLGLYALFGALLSICYLLSKFCGQLFKESGNRLFTAVVSH